MILLLFDRVLSLSFFSNGRKILFVSCYFHFFFISMPYLYLIVISVQIFFHISVPFGSYSFFVLEMLDHCLDPRKKKRPQKEHRGVIVIGRILFV